MSNKEFLMWIHSRLSQVHGEPELVDYMRKLHKVAEEVEEIEHDLYSLKADYSLHLDQIRDLLVDISKGGQAHAECTDKTSPTGLAIKELCNDRK